MTRVSGASDTARSEHGEQSASTLFVHFEMNRAVPREDAAALITIPCEKPGTRDDVGPLDAIRFELPHGQLAPNTPTTTCTIARSI